MMKYNYMKLFSFGFILTALCLFYTPGNSQSILDLGDFGAAEVHPTQYGPALGVGDELSGELTFILDGEDLGTACDGIAEDLEGKIAIIGIGYIEDDCSSADKVLAAMDAGASAVLLIMNDGTPTNFEDPQGLSDIPAYVGLDAGFSILYENVEIFEGITGTFYYAYDDSDVLLWSEDFSNGFDSDNGLWTTEGINSDTTLWTYAPSAQSGGELRHFLIDSPTRGNGAALMDNDAYLTVNGIPDGPPYGDVGGQLISPVIDLSESGPVVIKWWQYAVALNTEAETPIGLYYSTDGGDSWSARIDLDSQTKLSAVESDIYNPEIMRTFISEAAGVEEFRFKIEFRSDFYAMLVDDIQIIEAPGTDLAVKEVLYGLSNFQQPEFVFEHSEIELALDIENKGGEAQENVTIKIDLVDASGDVLSSQEAVYPGVIPVDEVTEVEFSETIKIGHLAPGSYKLVYTVIPEVEDEFPDNNSKGFDFIVTDNKFSMTPDNPALNSWYPSEGFLAAVGNVFRIPAEVEDNYRIGTVTTSYRNPGEGDVDGKVLTILVTAVPEEIGEDWAGFDFGWPEDPFSLPAIDQIAYQDIELAGTEQGQHVSSAPDGFTDAVTFDDNQTVQLENGLRYIIWSTTDDADLGVILSPTYPINWAPAPMIYAGDEQRYYTGFTSGAQAFIEMDVELVTTVDNTPLPEEAMTVYPNPVVGSQLFTDLKFENASNATITIADMNGVVKSIDVYENVVEQTIESDVSSLPAGTYIVRLATKEGTKTVKFIKQ